MTTPTDVVRELYAKLTAGDAQGALALMTDDVEWIPMMDYKVDRRGPQKVLEGMLAPAMAERETYTLVPRESIADSSKVVSIGSFHSAHRTTGKVAAVDYTHIWEIRSNKVARLRQYIDTARIESARHV
jgi:ketosteroid isomerase-like protein